MQGDLGGKLELMWCLGWEDPELYAQRVPWQMAETKVRAYQRYWGSTRRDHLNRITEIEVYVNQSISGLST